MVLSSFDHCWATCEATSEIREFSHPRSRNLDYFKPPEVNFVSQSCYHGYSRVVESNNPGEEQMYGGVKLPEVIPMEESCSTIPSRKRFFDTAEMHDKCKKPKLSEGN